MPSDSPARLPRRGLAWALAGYAVVLAFVLGWPTPVDTTFNKNLFTILRALHEQGLPSWVGYGEIEFAANVALFLPVGVLVTLMLRPGQWWLAVLAGFGFSTFAELAQGSLRPERFAMPRDVVANTLGTLLGAGVGLVISRRQVRAEQRAAHRITFEHVSRVEQANAVEQASPVERVRPVERVSPVERARPVERASTADVDESSVSGA